MTEKLPAKPSSTREIEAFLARAARTPALSQVKGRLVFAIDATMSRAPTWDAASEIHTDMFDVAQELGGLAVQLVWFRGRGEFQASGWATTPAALGSALRDVRCASGFTQLRRVLGRVHSEASAARVDALVYVGDCCEENPEFVLKEAGGLALLGVRAFMFHEGHDGNAAALFGEIARLTRGVYARFDSGAANRLRALLRAAAVYAAGGVPALKVYGERMGGEVKRLAHMLADRS